MSLGDALAEAAKLENDRYVFRDNSVLDKLTGRMFFSPTGGTQRIMTSKGPMELPTDLIRLGRPELIEQYIKNLPSTAEVAGGEAGARAGAERGQSPNQIKVNLPRADGTYGSYDIPAQAAFEIGKLITQYGINSPQVLREASKYTGEAAGPSAAPAALPGAAPAAAATAPPVGGVAGRVPSERNVPLQRLHQRRRLRLALQTLLNGNQSLVKSTSLPRRCKALQTGSLELWMRAVSLSACLLAPVLAPLFLV